MIYHLHDYCLSKDLQALGELMERAEKSCPLREDVLRNAFARNKGRRISRKSNPIQYARNKLLFLNKVEAAMAITSRQENVVSSQVAPIELLWTFFHFPAIACNSAQTKRINDNKANVIQNISLGTRVMTKRSANVNGILQLPSVSAHDITAVSLAQELLKHCNSK